MTMHHYKVDMFGSATSGWQDIWHRYSGPPEVESQQHWQAPVLSTGLRFAW